MTFFTGLAQSSTELLGKGTHAGPLHHTPIPATEEGMWAEQKAEKVSLSLD